jgi:hypothetical protein
MAAAQLCREPHRSMVVSYRILAFFPALHMKKNVVSPLPKPARPMLSRCLSQPLGESKLIVLLVEARSSKLDK